MNFKDSYVVVKKKKKKTVGGGSLYARLRADSQKNTEF